MNRKPAFKGFPDLQSLIANFASQKQLATVECEIDPILELPEVHRRVIAANGPALLFTKVKGSAFPVACNIFGTKARVDTALGVEAQALVERIAKLPETLLPPSFANLWSERGLLARLSRIGLKRTHRAPILANCNTAPNLNDLPFTQSWPLDGGPFLTLPLVYTEHPESGVHNLGMYRIQRYSDTETGFHTQIGKGGGFHLAEAERLGQDLPAAIFLGGPPAAIIAAIAPLPENVPELLLASLLLGNRLEMASSATSRLPLLAQAEFALVGKVLSSERREEGPFGDHYGYYSLKHPFPVFRCEAVFNRANAIFPATVVGKPRQEDYYIGSYLQELLAPLFPLVMPAVLDLWSYGETGFHSLAAAVVRERYSREAMVSAFRILGEGQLSLTKFLLITNERMDLRNFTAVLEHILARADFRTDLYLFGNLSMDTLDYTGPKLNEGSKGVLLGLNEPIRALPRQFEGELPSYLKRAEVYCAGCLVVEGTSHSSDPSLAERIAVEPTLGDWPLIVLVDNAKQTSASEQDFLWSTFTRFEPAADVYAKSQTLVRNHVSFEPPLVIDARMKPSYPQEVCCDDDTRELVNRRWKEYGIELDE